MTAAECILIVLVFVSLFTGLAAWATAGYSRGRHEVPAAAEHRACLWVFAVCGLGTGLFGYFGF